VLLDPQKLLELTRRTSLAAFVNKPLGMLWWITELQNMVSIYVQQLSEN
jgi:hypothetical protein